MLIQLWLKVKEQLIQSGQKSIISNLFHGYHFGYQYRFEH